MNFLWVIKMTFIHLTLFELTQFYGPKRYSFNCYCFFFQKLTLIYLDVIICLTAVLLLTYLVDSLSIDSFLKP